MRILIVEDDNLLAANLYDYFESHGHEPDAAHDGTAAVRLATSQPFDVIVLDIGLPGMDGLCVARQLREELQVSTPILMLTARDTLDDKLAGFAAGADDYLVKPFALREVEVRLEALHKRASGQLALRRLQVGDLSVDLVSQQAQFGDVALKIPPKCLKMLEQFLRQPDRVLTRMQLETSVWGDEQDTSDTLRSHLHTLRRALLESGGVCPIETVHGVGYRLLAELTHAQTP